MNRCLAYRVAAHELEESGALGWQVELPIGLVHAGGELRELHVGRHARRAGQPARREPDAVAHLREHVLDLETELDQLQLLLHWAWRRTARRARAESGGGTGGAPRARALSTGRQ